MQVYAGGVCHPGKVRKKNEDTCVMEKTVLDHTGETVISLKRNLAKHRLFSAVFDGMGGISAGEVASAMSAEAAQGVLSQNEQEETAAEQMGKIIAVANKNVCEQMLLDKKRMGSTASMLYFENESATLCNLGDSPIFLWRNGELTEIFEAHNERAAYEKLHGTTDRHKKFRLTQYIGVFPQEATLHPYVTEIPLEIGDRFLICSDGLTDMVEPEDIADLLKENNSPVHTAQRLLETALENGGKDNVSVLIFDVRNHTPFGFLKNLFIRKSGQPKNTECVGDT